mmetsp:Transcript_22846/g.91446  ORF Transcript_22846/g.91446 Transcript_22846/m.91446 type:complete len:92 (+) Transcript_22846:117-392(+)
MSKEQKPTLGSGAIKTRKRNIHTKNDPEAFRDKIFAIFDEAVSMFMDIAEKRRTFAPLGRFQSSRTGSSALTGEFRSHSRIAFREVKSNNS